MKKEVRTIADLEERVLFLQSVEKNQVAQVKADAAVVVKGLRPAVLLKGMVSDIVGSKTVQKNVIDTTVGFGAGILAKKLFTSGTAGILRRVTGKILQVITTRMVTKKMPAIRHKILQ